MEQMDFYRQKLAFETDSWDLFSAMKSQDNIEVLDTRTLDSFERGHIAGSKSFPHQSMTEEGTKNVRKDVLYVVYCDGIGCNASTSAAYKLSALGFQVKELIGGFEGWKDQGYPVDRPYSAFGALERLSCGCY